MAKYILDKSYWTHYLQRSLKPQESMLIDAVDFEISINQKLKNLYNHIQSKDMHFLKRTDMDGNCMFASLVELGFCDTVENLRRALAIEMILNKESKDIVPEFTLEEAFKNTNEIESISDDEDSVPYTYERMCIDVLTDGSWTRLNPELLMIVLSKKFNAKFTVFTETGYSTDIYHSDSNDSETRTFTLGLINDLHYLPLSPNEPGAKYRFEGYNTFMPLFSKWRRIVKLKKRSAVGTAAISEMPDILDHALDA